VVVSEWPTLAQLSAAVGGIALAAAIGSWIGDRLSIHRAALRVARRQMRQNDERGTIPKDSPAL
jgi:hypothetical protein